PPPDSVVQGATPDPHLWHIRAIFLLLSTLYVVDSFRPGLPDSSKSARIYVQQPCTKPALRPAPGLRISGRRILPTGRLPASLRSARLHSHADCVGRVSAVCRRSRRRLPNNHPRCHAPTAATGH